MSKTIRLKTATSEKNTHPGYFNIAFSVDCVIFCYEQKQLKVLTAESDLAEYAGMDSLLGDLVGPDEDLDAASHRVLSERTGIRNLYLEQVHTFGRVDRHPAGRVISTAYYSLVNIKDRALRLHTESLRWQPVNQLQQMAFDHREILDKCLASLRDQINERPVVFDLLPARFALRELQEVYEAILDTTLDRRNFRKKMTLTGWLTDLGEMEEDVPHRPGKLYRVSDRVIRLRRVVTNP